MSEDMERRGPGRPPTRGPEIIVKDKERIRQMGIKIFLGPHDKGSAKPAWTKRIAVEHLRKDARDMSKALEEGNVSSERRESYRRKLQQIEQRVTDIDASHEEAKAIYKADQDHYDKLAGEIAEEIKEKTPSRSAVKKRIVNPHTILKTEKTRGENGTTFTERKLLYQTIQKLRDQESNVGFLRKD